MNSALDFVTIDGIKCYSPDVAIDYADYPSTGFDLTEENSQKSFWVSSRNRLFSWLVGRNLLSHGTTRFLEIGCGTGDFIGQLESSELEVTGSEIYLKGLTYAQRNLPNVEFIQFDVTQGTIGRQFDLIVAFDVLEHIENDVAALSNMFEMLEEDRILIVSVPQHMFLWSQLDVLVEHKRRYSKAELMSKLKRAGFEIERSTSFVCALFPMLFLSRIMDKQKKETEIAKSGLRKRVSFSPLANWILAWFMRVDEWLIKRGMSLPFGGTLVVVASKKRNNV